MTITQTKGGALIEGQLQFEKTADHVHDIWRQVMSGEIF